MKVGNQNVVGLFDNTIVTDGALLPRLTSLQEAAVVTPVTGTLIFNTDLVLFRYFDGTIWVSLSAGGSGNLQDAYDNSVGGVVPEILLDATRGAVTIRDNAIGTMLDAQDGSGTSAATLGTTGVRTVGGSVTVPAHSFLSDTNTGIYSGTADIVGVAAGGADSAAFDHVTGTTGSYINIRGNSPTTAPIITNLGPDTNGVGLGIAITGRTASAAGAGGAIAVTSGAGNGAGAGGASSLTGGAGGATGAGGAVAISGGASGDGNVGGNITITSGAGTGTASAGGSVTISCGASTTGVVGNAITMTAGQGGSAGGAGGPVTVSGGSGGSTSGDGGSITIRGGASTDGNGGSASLLGRNAVGTNRSGGSLSLSAGNSTGVATGAALTLVSGAGGATGGGGAISLTAGAGGTTSGTGGAVSLAGGQGGFSGTGGAFTISGGAGGPANGAGGAVTIQGGATTDGNGGAVSLVGRSALGVNRSGGALSLTAGNATGNGGGGNITLAAGIANTGVGGGAGGSVSISSGTGLTPGDFSVATNGSTRLVMSSAGVLRLNSYTTGYLSSDASGFITSGPLPSSPPTFVAGNAGENVAAGAIVAIIDSAGPTIVNADANGAGNRTNPVGVVTTAATTGNPVTVQFAGRLSIPNAQWDVVPAAASVGAIAYLSEQGTTTTAGIWTLTSPATSGSTVIKCGILSRGGSGTIEVIVQIGDKTVLA